MTCSNIAKRLLFWLSCCRIKHSNHSCQAYLLKNFLDILVIVLLITKGEQHISLTLTEKGAIAFARELSNYILAENSLQMADENEDDNELLTKQEVKEKFNVSDTTLWLWAKKNYLVPVKIGRKVMYRTSDIKQLVNGKI